MMSMDSGDGLQEMWKEVNAMLRQGPINRSLWDAAMAAVPIAIDENTLVIGLPPAQMQYASYLSTPQNRNRILELVQARTGKRLDIRLIEGITTEAWERVKEREQANIERAVDQASFRAAHKTSLQIWEELGEKLVQMFRGTASRRIPQQMASLLVKAMPEVAASEQAAREADPEGKEIHFRELNRAFERLASYCDLPPTLVALEYMRYTSRKR